MKCFDSSSPWCRPDRPMSTMQLMLFDPGYRLTDDFQLSANLTAFRRGRLSQAGAYLDDVENLCVRAYVCMQVCVCTRARACACPRVCMSVCARAARAGLLDIHPSINSYMYISIYHIAYRRGGEPRVPGAAGRRHGGVSKAPGLHGHIRPA